MSRPVLIVALVLMLLSCAPTPPPLPELPSNVVATVGESSITRSDVDRMMAAMDRPGLSHWKLQQEAIEELIAQELLYQEAQRRGMEIGESEISAQLNLLQREFLSPAAFQIAKEEKEISDEQLRRQIRRDLAIARLLDQEVYARIAVSDEEMVTRPKEVHELYIFRRLVAGAPKSQSREAWDMIRQAREKVMAGADFRETAREYSQSGLAKHGGDAGFITYNPNNELSKTLFDLEEGHVSDIIETKAGLFILKAEQIRPEQMQAFGELSPKLQRIVLQNRMQERLDRFVEELRQKVNVRLTS